VSAGRLAERGVWVLGQTSRQTPASASASAHPSASDLQQGDRGEMVGDKGKKYGLQIPAARLAQRQGAGAGGRKVLKPTLGIFAAGEEEEEEEENINSQIKAYQQYSHSVAKNEEIYKAALTEDPTVFDYDSVYDSMKGNKESSKVETKTAEGRKASRYIADLKAKAVERQREQDVVYERKMVKDHKKDAHLYGDKETFVTSAYKKKLQEEQKWLEEEKRRDEEERREDVTKKKDLGGFYKNLLTNNVAFGTQSEGPKGEGTSSQPAGEVEETRSSGAASASKPRESVHPERRQREEARPSNVDLGSEDKSPREAPREALASAAEGQRGLVASRETRFIESSGGFSGVKPGYIFKQGPLGLGYYIDDPSAFSDLKVPSSKCVQSPGGTDPMKKPSEDVKRNTKDSIASARLRYLERKRKAGSMSTTT